MLCCPVCEQPNPTAEPENDSLVVDGRSVCSNRKCQELGKWYLEKLEAGDFAEQSAKLMESLDAAE